MFTSLEAFLFTPDIWWNGQIFGQDLQFIATEQASVIFYRKLPQTSLSKFWWLLQSWLGSPQMAATIAKNSRAKNPPRRHLQKNPNTVRPALQLTDDLAGFEIGTSITGIRAESFHTKAHPLGIWFRSGRWTDLDRFYTLRRMCNLTRQREVSCINSSLYSIWYVLISYL